ncbi:MAG TPA: beta-ketoacyl-ACP synthase III [Acidimicrobiales bacterium]|nr:beta-ketoacyl-ACP synthase III [Acidimicrobiales bacterium]
MTGLLAEPAAVPSLRRPPLRPPGAIIAGTGCYLPERRLTNADLEQVMSTSDAWILERTGIRERRIAAGDEATASMAIVAARAALADAGLSTTDVDLCIVATCTPDQVLPSTAAFVADALDLRGGALDVGAACAGFVYGLVTASALVATGGVRAALVIGSETLSRILDVSDRSTGMLFGDGAGAVVVCPTPVGDPSSQGEAAPEAPSGLLSWDLGCDGSATSILRVPAGGSRLPASAETVAAGLHVIQMDGREVYRRAIRAIVESVTATLDRAGVGPDEVDVFVPHQANARIIDAVLPRLGIAPERTITNIERYGNTSAASIPIALAEAHQAGRVHAGDLVLMTGFGAGMTWASALVRW